MTSILIVDDEKRFRDIYANIFTREGYKVLTARDAVEAREYLLNEPVHAILLDIKMDDIDGSQLYDVIQSFHKDVKVIVSSVYAVDDQKALIPDAHDYFDKSDEARTLVEKIKRLIPPQTNSAPKTKKSILVVDDDPTVRSLMSRLLGQKGYHSVETAKADEAIRFLKNKKGGVDLIILDLAMPQTTGIDLFEAIKTDYPGIKIMIASNYPIDEQKAIIFDADDYYDKSDGNPILLQKIETLLTDDNASG